MLGARSALKAVSPSPESGFYSQNRALSLFFGKSWSFRGRNSCFREILEFYGLFRSFTGFFIGFRRIGVIVAAHVGWPTGRFVPEDSLLAVIRGPEVYDMMIIEMMLAIEKEFGVEALREEKIGKKFSEISFGEFVDEVMRAPRLPAT